MCDGCRDPGCPGPCPCSRGCGRCFACEAARDAGINPLPVRTRTRSAGDRAPARPSFGAYRNEDDRWADAVGPNPEVLRREYPDHIVREIRYG